MASQPVLAAKANLTISQAKWSAGALTVNGKLKHGGASSVEIYDGSGRRLGEAPVDGGHRFRLKRADLDRPEQVCTVSAKTLDGSVAVPVKGRAKACAKAPVCQILRPIGSFQATVGTDMNFSAQATLKDKKAGPLKMEWDFAGGAMGEAVPNTTPTIYLRPTGSETTVRFVRDNGRYRVRFTAWDKQNRYCEDSVEVVVGNPPDGEPAFQDTLGAVRGMAQTAQGSAPPTGKPLSNQPDDWVVLPFQDWTMQNATDAKTMPNAVVPLGPPINNINAVVYRKGRQPKPVDADRAQLFYSASSSFADPVGPHSINTTSQNWPLDARLQDAKVQKSDWFDAYVRPEDQTGWLMPDYVSFSLEGFLDPLLPTVPDEGYHNATTINTDHGRYMPGISQPYQVNEAQPFSGFDTGASWFAASLLPVTDIDDTGRVNPNPLFRIEARNGDGNTVAVTELAIHASRDVRCRGCHQKGGLAARPEGFASRPYIRDFHDPDSDSLFDQEYAATANLGTIHGARDLNTAPFQFTDDPSPLVSIPIGTDGPLTCAGGASCHTSLIQTLPFNQPMIGDLMHEGGPAAKLIHIVHANFYYADASKTDLARDSNAGYPFRRGDWDPVTASTPNTLFPVKDANGQILPSERNCVICHGGLREQSYRDRMYTAGVTCYQCHGDMTAVSNRNLPWADEPDCGSCHTGNANRGQDGTKGFFSGGVMRVAFDEADHYATFRQPDPANPDEIRFAVPAMPVKLGNTYTDEYGNQQPAVTTLRLYRAGRDNHGQVPCAACHGPAHGIWPIRDPDANDNLTSRQLQGHSGPITECKVCHSADAFANVDDLDEGVHPANAMKGILGGPHNMHPVNDPNWWKGAAADTTPNESSGKIKGGWHNDYAKKPGRTAEDQCAACHGNDHKGTRLSKTPVDRDFVNAKGKKIHVAAGTPIGCDLCHSITLSCTQSPAGAECGQASDKVAVLPNQKPVITSPVETRVIIGSDYRHTLEAHDPDGDALTYQFGIPPDLGDTGPYDMLIDPDTREVSLSADTIAQGVLSGAWAGVANQPDMGNVPLLNYSVTVTDARGAQTTQNIWVTASCPDGLVIDHASASCAPVTILSTPLIAGMNAGETYRYKVQAQQRGGAPLNYSLQDAPAGMQVDASGAIVWKPQADQGGDISFTVAATGKGGSALQQVSVTVCSAPSLWDGTYRQCKGPISFASYPAWKLMVNGDAYHQEISAQHRDGLPMTFSLSARPDGMTIARIDDTHAVVDWVAQTATSGWVYYTVTADDGHGGSADLGVGNLVCAPPDVPGWRACVSPISFDAWPDSIMFSVGDSFSYRVSATHAKGLPLTYSLIDKPDGMSFDPATGLVDWTVTATPAPDASIHDPATVSFTVLATDNGTPQSSATQTVELYVCAAGMRWDLDLGICQGPVIVEPIPPVGVDAGTTLSHQVVATHPEGGNIHFSLSGEPSGMTIDPQGLITWPNAAADPDLGAIFSVTVVATDDGNLPTLQYLPVTVCGPPTHWSSGAQSCQ